jgi:hypothetical protein
MFLLFFQDHSRLWLGFFFSSNKPIFGGLIPLEKNRFSLWLDFLSFSFFKQTCFRALFHWKKIKIKSKKQIMIRLLLLLFLNKPFFGGLILLGGLRRPPKSLDGWAGLAWRWMQKTLMILVESTVTQR